MLKLVFFEFVTFKRGEEFLFCRSRRVMMAFRACLVLLAGLWGSPGCLFWECLERSTTCAVHPLSCYSGWQSWTGRQLAVGIQLCQHPESQNVPNHFCLNLVVISVINKSNESLSVISSSNKKNTGVFKGSVCDIHFIRLQEKLIPLCTEPIASSHLQWKVTPHTLQVLLSCSLFISRAGCMFILINASVLFLPAFKTVCLLPASDTVSVNNK